MKKLKLLIIPALLASVQLMAQNKSEDGKVGRTINKIGNKTAQVAVKGSSAIADKKYHDKVGPGGQTIYIDRHSKYYYVNARGKKVYVSKARLRNAPHDKH